MSTTAQEYKSRNLKEKRAKGHLAKPTRSFNRCNKCGRARSYIGYFGLCRICARDAVREGLLPGVKRSSW